MAPQAVQDLTTDEGSTLKSFRYQVRLGCGKHYSQWVYFLLPFYVDLKIWWAALSILVGAVFGYALLFVVFISRQRFKKHRERVAICASIVLSVVSALLFTLGMYVVQEVCCYIINTSLSFRHHISLIYVSSVFLGLGKLCHYVQIQIIVGSSHVSHYCLLPFPLSFRIGILAIHRLCLYCPLCYGWCFVCS